MMVCRGSHSHFPPSPARLPIDIARNIKEIILDHDVLHLTTRSLMNSPKFAALRRQHTSSALRHLHIALHVEDRVTAIIRKQRLLHYPLGTAIAGVKREYDFDCRKPKDEQWIREIYFFDENHEHFLVICLTYAQAKAFQTAHYIEMDLAFKMIAGKINVFTIAAWSDEGNRINTYAYVFINLETTEAYHKMFEKLFFHLGDVGRNPVHWAYLKQTDNAAGIRSITLDMCRKQAAGMYIGSSIC